VFHINLKTDFAYGQVIVGVRPTLPVQDISLLFGINVAVARSYWIKWSPWRLVMKRMN
jgi:hypothetical protein